MPHGDPNHHGHDSGRYYHDYSPRTSWMVFPLFADPCYPSHIHAHTCCADTPSLVYVRSGRPLPMPWVVPFIVGLFLTGISVACMAAFVMPVVGYVLLAILLLGG